MADKREREYNAAGLGCYMFKIEDNMIVDATKKGSCARFINHSCNPNSYTRIVAIDGKKKIIILAKQRIRRGEEITYDYMFPIEENKIPCNCGASNCRLWMN